MNLSRHRRIALVTEFYYPHLGGVTEHVHNLALQYIARGHTPIVITPHMEGGWQDPPFVRRTGRSVVVYKNGSFARMCVGWRLGRAIEEILRSERIELIHVHGALVPTLGLVAPEAARRVGIPVVATFHSWFRDSRAYRVFRRPLQRRLERLDARIAVSEPVISALSRYFSAEFDIIPNGVDVESFHPNGRMPGDALIRGPRLLFLGRLDPRNGLETVLAAMPRVLKVYPQAELLVAGDGPLLPYYKRLARPVADRVRFLGRVLDERADIYNTSDLYLCPTDRASFGITLLEAMSSGTPLVVSDIMGFRELTGDGQESVMVPVDDPEAWANNIIDLVADPDRRRRMGEAGRAKAQRFAWPRVAEEVFSVYERVLG